MDLTWIDRDPVLHIIDRATRCSVAKFMESESAEYTWNLIVEYWITVFTGYPYIIAHDQGPQFVAEYFQITCSQLGIISKATPTQSHNSLSLSERYHSLIKRVYRKLKGDDPQMKKDMPLSLAVHAVNNTAGPDGSTPSALVFGTVPRISQPNCDSMPLDEKARFKAMHTARMEMETITAQRRVASAFEA